MKKTFLNKWALPTAGTAFGAVISFFQINSYWADQHHFNGWWLAIGIVLSLAAIACGVKLINTSRHD